jgi:alanine dehydrogenase
VHGVTHYGVTNMPGAVPRTSTFALTNTTLHYVLRMAELGVEKAVTSDPALAQGANVWRGELVCRGAAESLGLPWRPLAPAA